MAKKNEKRKKLQTPLFVEDKPKSIVSEKVRGIRSNIMFSGVEEIRGIIVTSEKPAAGKSIVSANIAITYAQAGYKTLIIDGDMRKPTQHYHFETTNYDGLSNLIIGKSDFDKAIRSTRINNLDLLTSGPIPPNPSELIASTNFTNILDKLFSIYDFILIDTPPVISVTDAQVYLRNVDDCVLVIDTEHNNKNEIKKAKRLIEQADGHLLGAILNKTPKEKSSTYYYYGDDESND
ncbi:MULTISPECIES: polysaccharide biosynthesis tyrosine autokinase [unclassified Staphylococcus]|uniref:polysaccharide biosynthesis tyrosine autokinase n=1 Tax=unclassified Staphylococcus TaxID=91994 RepID=UPI00188207D8|nr:MULTISPECIES: polysaccharide biosynthesis tyrosine autokinase [unclassified Staphylococcus]MBF2758618.1 polysaccharide biosynthesis tyrosine autokinase [Staphylococcus haemolyticus]MBF2774912.1 polysaccharide biosynthesis tyrosine autokinase [Staphylococcus haemolyticus]MBF2777485.1 polysaccharide biosynthesis tyrosine autokinase [Staphylococcus haemolyticus]MBF2816210.1 polysaccharide biosynthesis tyrosine autokinase [Staphylococcus haemolyticus]MBF9721743.1 polysaccharide biosynthesis tyr